jgi:hypothetical protein
MQDAVAKVMQKVADDKAKASAQARAERLKRERRKRLLSLLLIPAVVAFGISLWIAIPRWRHPFRPPTGAAAERDARQAIAFAALLVERYRAVNGRPPPSLREAGATLPGVGYRVIDAGYELSVTVDGRPLVFLSGNDPDAFRRGGPVRQQRRP